ncbi:gas vesicle protein [Streptomyces sp. NPDC101158]|uniref:gas vesicle protein n=1 Tax=Streptomyces sp. NPDC101158 TaxID=3366117 RepID=UPI00381F8570
MSLPMTGQEPGHGRQVALVDLLDRLLNGGAVLTGDLVLTIADVDLVHINLRAVIRSITGDAPAPLCQPRHSPAQSRSVAGPSQEGVTHDGR